MSPTTKRESYQQTKHNGSSEAQQERIMFCLREHPQGLSNQELETILKMRISSITARINELRKQGLVECGGAKINKDTERLNATWRMKI
jgi:predicted transcriptional regulator